MYLITAKYYSLSPDVNIYPEFSTGLIYKRIVPSYFQQTPAIYTRGAQIPDARSPWHNFIL
jgi:hypothetical protein